MRTVSLGGRRAAGRVALIDDEDYQLISQYTWWIKDLDRPGRRVSRPYARTSVWRDGRAHELMMHTLLTGFAMTDHIDHDGLNNQRSNLRPATRAQNAQNQRPRHGHSSRFRGVTWHRKCRKWQATVNGRYLGLFASEIEAANAFDAAALAAWGEYAYLNRAAS